MNRPDRVLLVDDEAKLRRLVRANLASCGYEVVEAADAESAARLLRDESPDLMILDLMLPGMDGFELCELVRSHSTVPILMLTAREQRDDKVRGFELGGDDYLTKPFDPVELLARVKALLRRARLGRQAPPTCLTLGELEIDRTSRQARLRGRSLELTPTEYRLLAVLAEGAGQVQSHAELLTRVWGPDYRDEVGFLRQYVYFLRQKLEDQPGSPRYLRSRPGFGYYLATG